MLLMLLKKLVWPAWVQALWVKAKPYAEALLAGIIIGFGFAVPWRHKPRFEVHVNPNPVQPKPLPKTQAEIDAELVKLHRVK